LIVPYLRVLQVTEEKKYVKDPIPAKAILLGDAFDWAYEEICANPRILETLDEYFQKTLKLNRELEETVREDVYHHEKAATVFFRAHLYAGNLPAYIRDSESGDILQLDRFDWGPVSRREFWPLRLPRRVDDFVTNDDAVRNPNTLLHGAYRPVFLWRDEFERWLKKTFGHQKHGGGRPPGSGSWQVADELLLDEMRNMIKTGKAKSANDAARLLADRARGSGILASKQTRLANRYRKKFGPEKN